jgi:citrate lyase beta subunit
MAGGLCGCNSQGHPPHRVCSGRSDQSASTSPTSSSTNASQDLCDAGFDGPLAVHPNQLPIVHRVFTPSPVAVQRARRVVTIHREAVADGRGMIVDDDGRMVDEAVVRTARRMLAGVTLEEEQ